MYEYIYFIGHFGLFLRETHPMIYLEKRESHLLWKVNIAWLFFGMDKSSI